MPSERIDHFAAMRAETLPPEEPPEGAPIVSPVLIEWLEAQGFGGLDVATGSYPGTLDHMVAVSQAVTFCGGQRSVLNYLKSLVRSA